MSGPVEIPEPELLDPDRPLRRRGTQMSKDERPRDELLQNALDESCAYARALWRELDQVRGYLLTSLPPDPRVPGADRAGTTPVGPDDEDGWRAWAQTFTDVTSVLCGPHGDSGFGRARAQEEMQRRRAKASRTAVVRQARQALSSTGAAPAPHADVATQRRRGPNWPHVALTAALGVLALRRRARPRGPDG